MKILQILPELNIGGVERGVCDLSKALVEQGHQSFVISNGGKLESSLVASGGKHISMPVHIKRFKTLKLAKELYEVILDVNPDIIHVRSRMPAWVTYHALKKFKNNKPVHVSTFHGLYSFPIYSKVMANVDHVISISNTVEDISQKDIGNIIEACKILDNPHKKFKSIHIAGTNGKGSTAHIISSILQEEGYTVGLYTSPHLKDFRERIRINGIMISEKDVI